MNRGAAGTNTTPNLVSLQASGGLLAQSEVVRSRAIEAVLTCRQAMKTREAERAERQRLHEDWRSRADRLRRRNEELRTAALRTFSGQPPGRRDGVLPGGDHRANGFSPLRTPLRLPGAPAVLERVVGRASEVL